MAQALQVYHEESPGAKPRITLIFQPLAEGVTHTEDDLRQALTKMEGELRLAWLLPGKGRLLPAPQRGTDESRHLADARKRLAEVEMELSRLRETHQHTEDALQANKVALEDAQHEHAADKKALSDLQADMRNTKADLVQARTEADKATKDAAKAQDDAHKAHNAFADAKNEADAIRSELAALKRPQPPPSQTPPPPSAPQHAPAHTDKPREKP